MRISPLTALQARVERFVSTADPRQVLGPEAEAAAGLLAESLPTSWSDEAARALGWFHWFRCVAQQTYDGPDFRHALGLFRPLWGRMPDAVPDAIGAVLARESATPRPLEEALRLGNEAAERATAFRTTGDPAQLSEATVLLRRGIDMLREAGALPEMLQINLVEVLLQWHAGDEDPGTLEEAVSWASRTIHSLAPVADEQAVPLLGPLGGNLLNAYHSGAGSRTGRDPRLLSLAAAAWDRVQEKAADPETRVQVRLRLAAALIEGHLRTPSVEWVQQAAGCVERATEECDRADARAHGTLKTLTSVVPQHIAQDQPALLRARAGVLRALIGHHGSSDGERRAYRTDLGLCLRMTHSATGDVAALDEAVEVLRAALGGTDGTGPDAVSRMVSLANALKARVHNHVTGGHDARGRDDEGARDDIAEAERWARGAHQAVPEEVVPLSCLGNVLREKALLLRDVEAMRESARLNHAAVRTLDPSDPAYMTLLLNTGLSYKESATVTGDVSDADHAVAVLRTAAEHVEAHRPEHIPVRVELGHALMLRAELGEDREALAQGRQLLESVSAELPDGHAEARRAQLNLMDSYRVEFQLTLDSAAVEEALRLARHHLEDPALDDGERGLRLGRCAGALTAAYNNTQDRRLLDELLPVCRSAVRFAREGSFDRSQSLLELGACLVSVYEVSRDGTALLEAIDVLEEAASGPETWRTTPEAMARLAEARLHHARQLAPFMDLARRARESSPRIFTDLFAEPFTAHERELDAIVDLCRKSLALRAPGSQDRSVSLSYLAVALLGRARDRASAEDAREAAELLREAIRTGRADHPDRPLWGTNLVGALLDVHGYDGESPLLDEAEAAARESMAATSADDVLHVRALLMLSHVLARRDDGAGDSTAEVLELRRRVYRTTHFSLPERIDAAKTAGGLAATIGDWAGAAADYEAAVDLLPRLAGHRLDRSDRELLIADEFLLASQAAACALQLGDPHRALDPLERGRCILLGQLTETRSDLSDLRRQAPELAEELSSLGEAMTSLGASTDHAPTHAAGPTRDEHRLTVRSWERVRDEIRGLPGFESFLRPGVPDLGTLTEQGPVVVVNVATIRSDAIVLSEGTATCVPLPRADLMSVADRFTAFSSAVGVLHNPHEPAEKRWEAGTVALDTLTWLWEAVVEPVVRALDLTPGGASLPRLWWCPTGLLSLLPLHAAGQYSGGAAHGIADYVMSSYTTTLNALRPKDAAHNKSSRSHISRDPRLLVVATPEAPGAAPLRHAAADAQALAGLFPRSTVLTGENATKQAVLRELPEHTWAHFACHTRPGFLGRTANELVLRDGSLSLPDISTLSLDAELVFLASCGSAAGSYQLADEAHHVASSFQLAGFTHVIGTLWEVADGDATEFTTTLYGLLAEGVPPAEALHRVTHDLRERYPRSPWLWAPYVHMGS
ncbi:CHAT domain-containing protein [Streptomyces sp. NPDC059679]|uniref:CHAT domain-containing protein n=1 Tax=Streptomyces sp. NPDC059679 TaxID=3346903 RepID=UPI0036AA6073